MSIESEILRIQKNIADAYGAVADMGGAVPLDPSSENLAKAVRSIPAESGSGGDPIGTVISFMGKTAPSGYLACEGGVFEVGIYPKLAEFFRDQFGQVNYFGGNGTTTFAVPDMRNLFLRGYHGSTTALSGDVGKKQEATISPYDISTATSWNRPANKRSTPENCDTLLPITSTGVWYTDAYDGSENTGYRAYTARPVNMAVLYCIKAV